jgi:hypothetical protein
MIRASRPDESRSEETSLRRSPRERPELLARLERYAEENPISTALWCFALGVMIGWRLRP